MDKNIPLFYLTIGLGLLFLPQLAESVDPNLGMVANFLVIGYWSMAVIYALIVLFKNIFSTEGFFLLLYNLWLFLSLMCVAIGALAIVDDGIDQARWAVWLIFYGLTVGFFKRNEL